MALVPGPDGLVDWTDYLVTTQDGIREDCCLMPSAPRPPELRYESSECLQRRRRAGGESKPRKPDAPSRRLRSALPLDGAYSGV
jgi:hypothetical protein